MSSELPPDRALVRLAGGSAEEAVRAAMASEGCAGFAVGPDLLAGPGPATIAALARVGRVLVTWSLHGAAEEVASASTRLADFGATWVSVHAASGREAVEAAVAALAGTEASVLASTLEPGLDDAAVASLGMARTRGKSISRLSAAARDAGAAGIVCAPVDLAIVGDVAPGLARVVAGAASRRAAAEAVARGADYVIVPGLG